MSMPVRGCLGLGICKHARQRFHLKVSLAQQRVLLPHPRLHRMQREVVCSLRAGQHGLDRLVHGRLHLLRSVRVLCVSCRWLMRGEQAGHRRRSW